MLFADVLQFVLNTQVVGVGGASCGELGLACPGASYTAIAAAFATQGYFTQSDLIHWLLYDPAGHIGLWAPLLYVVAAFGGMVGVATGMPPKNYMWFFLGPAFYHWLIGQPMQVNATEWRVGDYPQNQTEVWRLAEVGLVNTRIVQRLQYKISRNMPPEGGPYGDGSVDVAYFFAWYDSLISELTMWMIQWTGIHNLRDETVLTGGAAAGNDTNIAPAPGEIVAAAGGTASGEASWILLSNLKWGILQDITSVQVQNADVRDSFITFLSSECGDVLSEYVDYNRLVAARNAKGNNLPEHVFVMMAGGGVATDLVSKLEKTHVPVPWSLRNLFKDRYIQDTGAEAPRLDKSGFGAFFTEEEKKQYTDALNFGRISCALYFNGVMNSLRWEAGHAFHKLVNSKRGILTPDHIVRALFYGWGIRRPGAAGGVNGGAEGELISDKDQTRRFLQDMILAYMVRNELRIAPKVLGNPRYGNSSKTEEYVQTHQRTIGQTTKFGELYSWATLVPYVQGVLLYLLAIGYPFACILIVVPGWHKTLFTWMSFWAWAKLWDVGFAVVGLMERSVWAMMGSNTENRVVSSMIVGMQDFTNVKVECSGGLLDDISIYGGARYAGSDLDCAVAHVCDLDCAGAAATGTSTIDQLLQLFDRTVVLGNALDLDLANAYYIYIMAALYLAVPAVTGQLVLGAKSGVSGLISTAIGGVAGEAGRAAGAGYSSDMTQKAKANAAALGQTAYFKGLRTGEGLQNTLGALDAKNMQAGYGLAGDFNSAAREYNDALADIKARNRDSATTALNFGRDLARLTPSMMSNMLGAADKSFGGKLSRMGFKLDDHGDKAEALASQSHTAAARVGASGNEAQQAPFAGQASQVTPEQIQQRAQQQMDRNVGNRQGAINNVGRGLAAAVDLAQSYGTANVNQGYSRQAAEAFAAKGNSAVLAAAANTMARGYQLAEGRLGAQAHFLGENEAWTARNAFATAVSGDLGAMGISAGVVDPGPKPTHFEGAAMTGMLGGDAQKKAHYADTQDSGFWGGASPYFQQRAKAMYDNDDPYYKAFAGNPSAENARNLENSGKSALGDLNGAIYSSSVQDGYSNAFFGGSQPVELGHINSAGQVEKDSGFNLITGSLNDQFDVNSHIHGANFMGGDTVGRPLQASGQSPGGIQTQGMAVPDVFKANLGAIKHFVNAEDFASKADKDHPELAEKERSNR